MDLWRQRAGGSLFLPHRNLKNKSKVLAFSFCDLNYPKEFYRVTRLIPSLLMLTDTFESQS